MKRLAGLGIILALTLGGTAVLAQDEERGEVGVFADYVRLRHANNTNFWGPGAQIAFNLNDHVQLEAGMSYLPERTFVTTTGTGTTTVTTQTGLRLLQGMFGPKFQTGIGPVKAFLVLKGGFLNFGVSNRGIGAGFAGAVGNIADGDTNGVFYPGVGFEVGRRFGLRAEVGDLMYFDRGANHNLRVAVGPTFRF
jgi:hypothetical protein